MKKLFTAFLFCLVLCSSKSVHHETGTHAATYMATDDSISKALVVLQFNIWQEGTQVTGGFDAIVNEIARSNADFVTLSEVRNYGGVDFTAKLVSSLAAKGLTYYSSRNDNTGILSRYPVLSTKKVYNGDVYKFVTSVEAQRVVIYSAHIDYTHYACYYPRGYDPNTFSQLPAPVTDTNIIRQENLASSRDEAIAALLADAQSEIEDKSAIFIGGDFNEPSALDWTDATKNMFGHNGVVYHWDNTQTLMNSGFVDSYRKIYPDPVTNPGFTWTSNTPDASVSSQAWTPNADDRDRIDFIFYYPISNLELKHSQVVGPEGNIIGTTRNYDSFSDTMLLPLGVWPSDHKALLSTFELKTIAAEDDGGTQPETVPDADLLNVQFNKDTTVDISGQKFPVTTGSTAPAVLYDSSIHQYVAHFEGTGSTTYDYFKVDYKDSSAFKTKAENAFTLAAYIKPLSDPGGMSSVSSNEGGGFGIYHESGGVTDMYFGQTGGSYTIAGTKSIYDADNPQYSLVVFTWDGTSLKAYYDGILHDAVEPSTGLYWSAKTAAQWIAIGGDAGNGDFAQYGFNGNIASSVLMYSSALSAGQVTALNQQFQDRKALANIDSLNTLLAVRLPALKSHTSESATLIKIENLTEEGWALMQSMTTTDEEIQTYFTKVNNQLGNSLPVTLSNFSARVSGISDVLLQWNSNVAHNLKNYIVQKSNDASRWADVATIQPKGANRQYTFTDSRVDAGRNYYRICEEYLDNTKEYSDIKTVEIEANGNAAIKIYPNPTRGVVHVVSSTPIAVPSVSVFNLAGSRIKAQVKAVDGGIEINLSGNNAGIYFIKIGNRVLKAVKI